MRSMISASGETEDAPVSKSVADISMRVQISPGACKSDRKEVKIMLEIKGKINKRPLYALAPVRS